MKQIIEKSNYNVLASPLYIPFNGLGNLAFTAANFYGIPYTKVAMPVAGTFRNLTVYCPDAHPSVTVTFVKNDSPEDLVVEVASIDSLGSNTTDEVSVAVSDFVYLKVQRGSAHAAFTINISVEFEGDEQFFGVVPVGGSQTSGATYVCGILGNGFWVGNTTPCNNYSICAADGEVTSLLLRNHQPDIGAGNFTAYILKNSIQQDGTGGTVDTTTVITGESDYEQSTFSLPVEVGDVVEVRMVYTGGNLSFQANWVGASITFTPDVAETYMLVGGNNESFTPGTNEYVWVASDPTVTVEAEHAAPVGFTGLTAHGLFINIDTDIIGGSLTAVLRKNFADTSITVTIPEGEHTGLIEGEDVEFVFGDFLDIKITTTDFETGTYRFHWGLAATAGTEVVENGSITVIKVTVPSSDTTEFDFTTENLDPASFSLSHGEEQEFLDLTPGSDYSVVETPNEDYTTVYQVSNGSPNTAIAVAAGEDVVVTVTNTNNAAATPGAGIYFIEEGKTDDTLWVDATEGTTEDVEIPRPFVKTGIIGR